MMLNLSHPLCSETPVYGGGTPVLQSGKRMDRGDSCNTLEMSMTNHTGTHIDLPAHFDESGKTLTDYPPEFWFVKRVECVFMDKPEKALEGKLINFGDIQPSIGNNKNWDCEAILLKTGFSKKRESIVYWKNSPGIDPALPEFLRETFPCLRFFGIDFISVSSYANREAGRDAHRAFLCHPNPILPIEDMELSCLPETLSNLLVAPLNLKNADGAPCTVFADIGV